MRIERSFCPLTELAEEACLQCISREASVRLQCLSKKHAYNAYRKKHLSAYCACRKEQAYSAYREEHLSAYNACRKEHAYKGIERSVSRGE